VLIFKTGFVILPLD